MSEHSEHLIPLSAGKDRIVTTFENFRPDLTRSVLKYLFELVDQDDRGPTPLKYTSSLRNIRQELEGFRQKVKDTSEERVAVSKLARQLVAEAESKLERLKIRHHLFHDFFQKHMEKFDYKCPEDMDVIEYHIHERLISISIVPEENKKEYVYNFLLI